MRSQVMRQYSAQYSHAAALHGQLVDGDGHLQAANHCRAALPNDSGNGGPGLDVLDCPRHVLVSHYHDTMDADAMDAAAMDAATRVPVGSVAGIAPGARGAEP